MQLFFELESVYIVIGIFFLLITLYVTSREFMPKVALNRGIISVTIIISIFISLHYFFTVKRMNEIKEIFNNGGTVICENKMHRTISQSVLISKKSTWELHGNLFTSKNFQRAFHTARCVDYAPIAPK